MPSPFNRKVKGLKPMSVNRAFYGRRYPTKEYQAYKTDLGFLLGKIQPITGYVQVHLKFGVPKKTFIKADCDNWNKPSLDALVERGVIEDDRFVLKLTTEKYLSEDYEIDIEVRSFIP